jgi:hypothetical protein
MHLLGRVDQQEEKCERARCDGGEIHRKNRHFFEQFLELSCPRIAASAGSAREAKRVYRAKRLITFESPYYNAERAGESADVVV